jgi:DNA-binding transcriptional LysR family regulator
MEQGGIVRVSASPAALGGLIQGLLDKFAESYPDIQLHISESGGSDPLGGVTDASADMICTREPSVIPEGWTFERCLDDALIAVCGQNHPLARKESITAEELGKCKWLLNRVGSVARDRFEEISEARAWPRSARCQIIMHIPELTKEMLLTGKYLAILPRSVALPWLESGEIIKLLTEIDTPLGPLGFLWRKEQSGSATSIFAAHLKPALPK